MKKETTKERILKQALNLFAGEGYEAVSVDQIAKAVGIKAPSLYKHYKSKQDIFDSILQTMERRDRENAEACSVPEETMESSPEAYAQASVNDLIAFSQMQFRYWTEDEFASAFRRMLTVQQYKSAEMNRLYHQYLGAGPLGYVADLLGSMDEAMQFYGPMYMLYGVYDQAQDKEAVFALLDDHLKRWRR